MVEILVYTGVYWPGQIERVPWRVSDCRDTSSQYFVFFCCRQLVDFVIEHHFPGIRKSSNKYMVTTSSRLCHYQVYDNSSCHFFLI